MPFKVGDLIVREPHDALSREIVTRVYQNEKGEDRMTSRFLSCGNVHANCNPKNFTYCPLTLWVNVAGRVQKAIKPNMAFLLDKHEYIVLPSRDIPKPVAQILVLEGLLDKPVALKKLLSGIDISYGEYFMQAGKANRRRLGRTAHLYKVLKPLEDYESRWW